jgi:hypothetical protein
MAARLKDPDFVNRVFIEAGVPTWPNGYHYGPSALYTEMREAGALQSAAAEGSLGRRRRFLAHHRQ